MQDDIQWWQQRGQWALLEPNRHDQDATMKIIDMIESNYLRKDDVGIDGTVVTVAGIEKTNLAREGEAAKYRWTMLTEEFDKPLVLNATNIQLLQQILGGDDTDDWTGKQVVLYDEPNVSFGGKLVGGIRVRAYRAKAAPRTITKPSQRPNKPSEAEINRQLAQAADDDGIEM